MKRRDDLRPAISATCRAFTAAVPGQPHVGTAGGDESEDRVVLAIERGLSA